MEPGNSSVNKEESKVQPVQPKVRSMKPQGKSFNTHLIDLTAEKKPIVEMTEEKPKGRFGEIIKHQGL